DGCSSWCFQYQRWRDLPTRREVSCRHGPSGTGCTARRSTTGAQPVSTTRSTNRTWRETKRRRGYSAAVLGDEVEREIGDRFPALLTDGEVGAAGQLVELGQRRGFGVARVVGAVEAGGDDVVVAAGQEQERRVLPGEV